MLDLYCIRVSPASSPGKEFVQADGTLGGLSVFQSKAAWGAKTVTGLASDTQYTFRVRACRTTARLLPVRVELLQRAARQPFLFARLTIRRPARLSTKRSWE